jgi:hypothetical protein
VKNKPKKTAVEYENFPSITEYEHVELPDVLYENEAAFEYEEVLSCRYFKWRTLSSEVLS